MLDDPAVPIEKLFPLLFMMMGPIGAMPVFAALTATGALHGLRRDDALAHSRCRIWRAANLLLGMAGAVIGVVVFKMAVLLAELDAVAISARDILSTVLGSLARALVAQEQASSRSQSRTR